MKINLSLTLLAYVLAMASSVSAKSVVTDRIAAVVGSNIILLSEVHVQMNMLKRQIQEQGAEMNFSFPQLEKMALESMIDDTLVAQQAEEMGIEVSQQEAINAVLGMAKENKMNMEEFQSAIESTGTTMDQYQKSVKKDLLKFKVMNMRVSSRVNITEERAREFYNDQVREVRRSANYKGAHILIRVDPNARAIDVVRKREEALELKNRILAGDKFDEIAMEYSQDEATKQRGGFLGELKPGDLPRILDNAFLDMEEGEITGPVKTASGFHVLILIEREDSGIRSFEEVKFSIIGQLSQRELEQQQRIWLDELRRKIFINIRI
jgi:peptidyl-prolyl cis-trans isomerase SurA